MQRRQNTYVLTYVCARPAGDPLSVPGPLHAAERVAEALCHHLLEGDALGGDPTAGAQTVARVPPRGFRQLGRRSEEHTSELQSLMRISYAVFCLKKKKKITT